MRPYSGITIDTFTFTDVGSSDKDGRRIVAYAWRRAIVVKARTSQGSSTAARRRQASTARW